jgi:hypothetical protein
MACPTCDHTMQCVATNTFWCPRCGTLKMVDSRCPEEIVEPKLVRRAFNLCEEILTHAGLTEGIVRTEAAVRECCLTPENR